MNVLIGCEFSGIVRDAFIERGHDAWSCDLLDTEKPGPHLKMDVFEAIKVKQWDLAIFHPPCTWLCGAMRTNAARKDRPNITQIFFQEREKAYNFVMGLANSPIEKIAIENPVGYLNSKWKKPNQVIRPWMFGHPFKKDISLWLKNLPNLTPTCIIPPPYKTFDFWSTDRNPGGKSLKSITFTGIAQAMAEQWG